MPIPRLTTSPLWKYCAARRAMKCLLKGFQYDRLFIPGDSIGLVCVDGECIGYSFVIRYPSYRGTFLSCIESLSLKVDGTPVPAEQVRFCLKGKEFMLDELKNLHREYWFVLEDVHLRTIGAELAPGAHTVRVAMDHRIPYTGYFGQYLIWNNTCEKTLTLAEGGRNA